MNLGEYKAGCTKDISDNLVLMNTRRMFVSILV